MPLTAATIDRINNAILNNDSLDVAAVTVSAHTGDPGTTGANEVTGGAGPYARQTLTCGTAASSKSIASTVAVNFAGMPAVTVSYVGFWDGTTFLGGEALTVSKALNAGDTLSFAIGELVNSITGNFSTYAANKALDAIFRSVAFVVAQAYTSLHDADPGDSGANEIANAGYARQATSYGASASGQCANDSAERFDDTGATVTHSGIWDASTAGNFLMGNSITVSSYSVEIAVGDIVVG